MKPRHSFGNICTFINFRSRCQALLNAAKVKTSAQSLSIHLRLKITHKACTVQQLYGDVALTNRILISCCFRKHKTQILIATTPMQCIKYFFLSL